MARRARRIAVLTVTGVAVIGAAGTAYAAMRAPAPAYRLATATSADVTATLQAVGTVTPVHQADVSFPVTGTVASIAVTTGQHVAAGQTLGSIDTAALKARLTAAKSTLASAEAKVETDITSQAASSSSSQQPTSSIARLQKAVLAAQRRVDGALQQAQRALAQAKQVCATAPTPTPTPTPTASANPQASPPPPSCTEAEQNTLDAEVAVLKAQQALSADLTKLDKALSASAAGGGKTSGGGGSSGSGTAVTAAQLAADQASADAAAAQVSVARQNLAAAKAVSPISGKVITIGVSVGGSTSAGSAAFVIAGLGAYQVVTQVAVADLPAIKVGQKASVLPDGTRTPLTGSVTSIGLVPASGSSTTYPVTISLTGPTSGLHAGINASVTITEARGRGVSVPTSAVHKLGRIATVTVYAGGKTQVTPIRIGTEGPVLTQVTSGLKAGQQVVLADLNLPLPSNSLFSRSGGPPRFGGGGPGFRRVTRVGG